MPASWAWTLVTRSRWRHGAVKCVTKIRVTDRVPKGMIWMSFHYAASPSNAVTSDALDPITRTGEYKVCAVKVEKLAS